MKLTIRIKSNPDGSIRQESWKNGRRIGAVVFRRGIATRYGFNKANEPVSKAG